MDTLKNLYSLFEGRQKAFNTFKCGIFRLPPTESTGHPSRIKILTSK